MKFCLPNKDSISKKNIAALVIYLCALSSPWLLDRATEALDLQPYRPGDAWYRSIWKSDYRYEKITSIGPKPPTIVSIISFVREREPAEAFGENDRCNARSFLAKLLVRINKAAPKAIVIDRWFGPTDATTCPPEDTGTKELATAIGQVSPSTPIIIATESVSHDEVSGYCTPSIELPKDTLILKPRIHFEDDNQNVHYGLARLNEENKKIPLGWYAYADCKEAQSKLERNRQLLPTLALESVSVVNRKSITEILQKGGLQAEYDKTRHPFTHFREEPFPNFSALRVLCGDHPQGDWRTCSARNSDEVDLQELRGQIVVIGDVSTSDLHDSVFGKMPGMLLQAHYIESLWESRFFRPILNALQIGASLCLFLIVELIFRWKASSPGVALVLSITLVAVLLAICIPLMVAYFGFYPDLLFPGLLAMFGKWLQAFLEKAYEGKKKKAALQGAPAN